MLTIIMSSLFLLPLSLYKTSLNWLISLIALLTLSILSIIYVFPYGPSIVISPPFLHVDYLSTPLIILTLWISSLMIIASYLNLINKKSPYMFVFLVNFLSLILIICFSQTNIIMFYLFFESSLIPTLFLILGWGYQPERLQASFYLMIYTVAASLPLLLAILVLQHFNFSASFINFFWFASFYMTPIWWFFIIFAFLVKMPLFLVHLWLPKAHVEAPVAGSMILAAILLKLGSYGLIRMSSLFTFMNNTMLPLISTIAMWGAFITSTICIRQPDMKSLIAYSSVGHMGLLTAGLMTNSIWGWEGSMMMMVAHGLSSSALFALANSLYETTHTRSLFLTKGMLAFFPLMTAIWFMFSAANMAAPPTINLASEILLLTSILSSSIFFFPLIALTSFLAAVYSLYLYTATQHGSPINYTNPLVLFNQRNLSLFLLHFIPLFFIILKPDIIILWATL